MIKIVQINTVCGSGSTGRIAVNLYKAAEEEKMQPYIAYGRDNAPSEINSYKISGKADMLLHVGINFVLGRNGFGSKSVTRKFLKWLDQCKPDVIHLHNLHGFYLHVGLLFEYIKQKQIPVIWTLHDCWPFTGQCAHFDYAGCSKWIEGCYQCPVYRKDYPYSLFCDNSEENYRIKKEAFTGVAHLTIVTPSLWMENLVKKSFLKGYPVVTVRNGIDLETFQPPEIEESRDKLVLGVANIWTEKKGLNHFIELSDLLDDTYQVVLIGLNKKQMIQTERASGGRIRALPRTENVKELVNWYRRASVYVNPTLEDNFPTTNLEALACGTPVITYNTGGSVESIDDSCGIIVEKEDLQGLKRAILSLDDHKKITNAACRKKALNYSYMECFQNYIELYRNQSRQYKKNQ